MDWVVKLLAQTIGYSLLIVLGIGILFAGVSYLLSAPEERKSLEENDTECMVVGRIYNGTEPKE